MVTFALVDQYSVCLAQDESENSDDENEEKDSSTFYDKKSSFFDSISCESKEKAEG